MFIDQQKLQNFQLYEIAYCVTFPIKFDGKALVGNFIILLG